MRLQHTAVAVIGLLFMVSGATAVVGGPEPGENEMAIMGQGSSASASKAVGQNGTQWTVETSMVNRSSNITDGRLENIQYSQKNYSVEFEGHIQAPTPCHVIAHEVDETGDSYVLNVKTVHDDTDEESNGTIQPCIQQLVMIEYDGSFSAQEDFTLEVRHNNETVNTLAHPGLDQSDDVEEKPKTGFMQSLRNLFSGLF